MERRAQQRREIEADLREVLREQTWTLAYQPIFDVAERRMVGLEALLRWTHPERGPVSPFELIRLAEDTGSIVTLGREIFRRACEDAGRWHAMGFPLPVSINVSARQLRDPNFVDDVRTVLEETAMRPELLVVELTETVLASREHGEIETLEAVRALGCRVALDDFGTGYSSLGELRDLPIDVVKLDQVFISDLPGSTTAAAMVEAVVLLAEALELVVVAEGVEQDDQVEALSSLGCHRAQGFALARPVAPHVITGMLLDARQPTE
jgi:EAL domain-containing protein (putative c-di-GMP-specific phosphodiesterase class I)